MPPQLFSIGHSTHPLDRLIDLLRQHGVEVLADIRRFPGSRKFPHFGQEQLAAALPAAGIEYRWIEALGGRRPKQRGGPSVNLGLRNESFRNYADYMSTYEFRKGAVELVELAQNKPSAMMCSEGLFWQCHRRLVSDYLLTQGVTVQHIMPAGELRPHTLTTGAKIAAGVVTYPAAGSEQATLPFE